MRINLGDVVFGCFILVVCIILYGASCIDSDFTSPICTIESANYTGELFKVRIENSHGVGIEIETGKEIAFIQPFTITSTDNVIQYSYDSWDSWEDVVANKSQVLRGI